jgi:hypothetical protein
LEPFATDPDAIANGAIVALHQIEKSLLGMHDNGPGCFGGAEKHRLSPKLRRQSLVLGARNQAGAFLVIVVLRLRGSRPRA